MSFVQDHKFVSSLSDDPQHQKAEERKQKRMLSNRESARRSRMKKQQHLDDLQAQLTQLRLENSALINRLHDVSQYYRTIEEQNNLSRSLVMDLLSKLQALNDILQQQAGKGPLLNSRFSDSNPVEIEKL
ncbi:hypothetical protein SUGI_0407720 [Cryptomeria japonica]|nr:hypothetical protein SUGI_0407720 [Cryptomeria japonica]